MGLVKKKLLLLILLISFVNTAWATDYTQDAACKVAYLFNEASGNAADSSTSARTGTAANITYGNAGQFGNSFSFNGSNSSLVFSGLTTGTSFTIISYIYPATPSSDYGNFLTTDGGAEGLWLRSSRKITYYKDSDHENNTALTNTTWNHYAVVSNALSLTFYLGGATDGTNSIGGSGILTRMGTDSGANEEPLLARVDELAIFTRALNSTEVNDIKDNGLKGIAVASAHVDLTRGVSLIRGASKIQ